MYGVIEIFGLPAHPLLVHLPVIVVPAFLLTLLAYLLIVPARAKLGWVVMVLSVLAPLSTAAAWYTGHQFYDEHIDVITAAGADTTKFTTLLADHLAHGDVLIWVMVAMAPVTWLFGALERGRRAAARRATPGDPDGTASPASAPSSESDPASRGRKVVMVVLAVVLLGLSAGAGWYTYQTGHSGAKVVWGTPKGS